MRIVYYIPTLLRGGLERNLYDLATNIDRRHFDPIVMYSGPWGSFGHLLSASGIQVERLGGLGADYNTIHIAVDRLRDFRPFFFHSFSYRSDAADILAASLAGAEALFLTRADLRWWDTMSEVRRWELLRNQLCDVVIANCERVARCCGEVERIPPSRIAVVPNGVCRPSLQRVRREPQKSDILRLLAVGNLKPVKGHDVLLDAMQSLVFSDRLPIALSICGADYGVRQLLEERIKLYGLGRYVSLLGGVEDVSALYDKADLFVHPSRSEGLSQAVLEAMAMGLPVVASNVGGTGEVIETGRNGILVPPDDSTSLAEAIRSLVRDKGLRQALGKAAQETCERSFPVSKMVEGYSLIYRKFLRNPAAIHTVKQTYPATQVTLFVATVGDTDNLSDCIQHLRQQTIDARIQLIDHVAPLSSALQEMIERCETRYYIQVDEDMLLSPDCTERLLEAIEKAPPNTAIVSAPLWDQSLGQAIHGVKLYRYEYVRTCGYRDVMSSEIDHLTHLLEKGFHIEVLPLGTRQACFGEHGCHYTAATAFARWQRLFQKHRRYGNLQWIEVWPQRLLDRYVVSNDEKDLYAFLGAVAGIVGKCFDDKEVDWRTGVSAEFAALSCYFRNYR